MEYTSGNFFIETIVPVDELIVSRTDLNGIITYANDVFAEISGYTPEELIGKPHNIVRHPDMPKSVFVELWRSLKEKGKWSGCIKNLRKDQGFYWVYAEISQVYKDGELIEYKSVRTPISHEEKLEHQVKYDEMKETFKEPQRRVIYE